MGFKVDWNYCILFINVWRKLIVSLVRHQARESDGANIIDPLAAERVSVTLLSLSKPIMQLLHVFQSNFVKQVIICLARGSKCFLLIQALLLQPAF